jgi:hypothetical protein
MGKSFSPNVFHTTRDPILCLFDESRFVIPFVGNLRDVKSCVFNEVFRMAFLATSVSVFNNFIPTFTKPDTLTFVNNIVNCLSTNSNIRETVINSHDWKRNKVCVISVNFSQTYHNWIHVISPVILAVALHVVCYTPLWCRTAEENSSNLKQLYVLYTLLRSILISF